MGRIFGGAIKEAKSGKRKKPVATRVIAFGLLSFPITNLIQHFEKNLVTKCRLYFIAVFQKGEDSFSIGCSIGEKSPCKMPDEYGGY